MNGRFGLFCVPSLALAACVLVACAKPAASTSLPDSGTSLGPTSDLAGFITPTPDLAQPVSHDMTTLPTDMAQPPSDMSMQSGACGNITYAGVCNGNVLSYCKTNQLKTIDCGASAMVCKVDPAGDADCHFVAGAACGSLDAAGVCDGNTVAYCSGGKVVLIDCTASGRTCNDTFFADCL